MPDTTIPRGMEMMDKTKMEFEHTRTWSFHNQAVHLAHRIGVFVTLIFSYEKLIFSVAEVLKTSTITIKL